MSSALPGVARRRRSSRQPALGFVVTDLSNPFFADIVTGVEDAAAAAGYELRIGDSGGDPTVEATHLKSFERHRVRGVLLAPVQEASDQADQLRRHGIPVVLVDRVGHDPGYCAVAVDDVEGGRLAMGHLTALGHRRIAFVGGPGSLHQVRDRLLGAKLAGAGYASELRLRTVLTTELDLPAGRKAAATLVALPLGERPTAVFAANDLLAIGLLQGFREAGLAVPDDIALVGYDDIDLAATAPVALSTVRQPRDQLGHRATALLLEEISAAEGAEHEHQEIRYVPELVARASSARVRGGVRAR